MAPHCARRCSTPSAIHVRLKLSGPPAHARLRGASERPIRTCPELAREMSSEAGWERIQVVLVDGPLGSLHRGGGSDLDFGSTTSGQMATQARSTWHRWARVLTGASARATHRVSLARKRLGRSNAPRPSGRGAFAPRRARAKRFVIY